MFKKIFKKSEKNGKTPTLPEAILKMKATEETLYKKQAFLEGKIVKEVASAKQNAKKNKKSALEALARKRRYEKQLAQIDATLTTLENQRLHLEAANTNVMAVDSMQTASKALHKAQKGLDSDKVQDILDNMAEEKEVMEEISEAIARPVSFDEVDEDDLERELRELNLEEEEEELPNVPQGEVGEREAKVREKKVAVAS